MKVKDHLDWDKKLSLELDGVKVILNDKVRVTFALYAPPSDEDGKLGLKPVARIPVVVTALKHDDSKIPPHQRNKLNLNACVNQAKDWLVECLGDATSALRATI